MGKNDNNKVMNDMIFGARNKSRLTLTATPPDKHKALNDFIRDGRNDNQISIPVDGDMWRKGASGNAPSVTTDSGSEQPAPSTPKANAGAGVGYDPQREYTANDWLKDEIQFRKYGIRSRR